MDVLESVHRPLTPGERRLLRIKIGSIRARGRRVSAAYLPIAAAVAAALWIWTLLASDAPWFIVTAFWLVVWTGLALWVRRDVRRDVGESEGIARGLESALRRNEANVFDVRASALVEFEEIEDEGACYAFALENDRLVFIQGQEFYAGAKFPSLDFSLVYVLDEQGATVDMLIDKRGRRTAPARVVSAAIKGELELPEHLETRVGGIDDIEQLVRRRL